MNDMLAKYMLYAMIGLAPFVAADSPDARVRTGPTTVSTDPNKGHVVANAKGADVWAVDGHHDADKLGGLPWKQGRLPHLVTAAPQTKVKPWEFMVKNGNEAAKCWMYGGGQTNDYREPTTFSFETVPASGGADAGRLSLYFCGCWGNYLAKCEVVTGPRTGGRVFYRPEGVSSDKSCMDSVRAFPP